MAFFKMFLASLYAAGSPDLKAASRILKIEQTSPVSQGLFVERDFKVLIAVTSSMHLLMKFNTASVYSCRFIQSPEVAMSLKMLHLVHSKQSFSAGTASCGHTLMLPAYDRPSVMFVNSRGF